MKFCDDDDVWRYFRESRAIEAMEDTFRMSAEGELNSSRFGVDTPWVTEVLPGTSDTRFYVPETWSVTASFWKEPG